jgi:hypothetical protein
VLDTHIVSWTYPYHTLEEIVSIHDMKEMERVKVPSGSQRHGRENDQQNHIQMHPSHTKIPPDSATTTPFTENR